MRPCLAIATFALLAASASAQEAPAPLREPGDGVRVSTVGTDQTVTVRLRCGGRPISCSNAPLYVLDGVALATGPCGEVPELTSLSPDDIVNVEVLRGGEAAAAYGAAAQNGVIAITTRRAAVAGLAVGAVVSDPFPNPAPPGARVTLRVEADGPARADVVDALGRRVLRVAGDAGGVTVPTAGLAAGVYVVRVEAGGETASRRLFVR